MVVPRSNGGTLRNDLNDDRRDITELTNRHAIENNVIKTMSRLKQERNVSTQFILNLRCGYFRQDL